MLISSSIGDTPGSPQTDIVVRAGSFVAATGPALGTGAASDELDTVDFDQHQVLMTATSMAAFSTSIEICPLESLQPWFLNGPKA